MSERTLFTSASPVVSATTEATPPEQAAPLSPGQQEQEQRAAIDARADAKGKALLEKAVETFAAAEHQYTGSMINTGEAAWAYVEHKIATSGSLAARKDALTQGQRA